jgi:lysophospholipase L1-like esterase
MKPLGRFYQRILEKARDFSASPVLIVAFGDSVTQGYTSANTIEPKYVYHQRLKEQLESRYPLTTFSVINAGVAGFTAEGSLARLNRDVIRYQPDLTLIAFGLNDAVVLGREGLGQFQHALQTIIDRVRAETESDIVLLTPNFMVTKNNPNIHASERHYLEGLLPIQGSGLLAQYADVIRQVAIHNHLSLADVYQSWSDLATNGVDTNRMLANGLNHPTAEAQAIPAQLLFELILNMENEARS